jgi:hypothetical protein
MGKKNGKLTGSGLISFVGDLMTNRTIIKRSSLWQPSTPQTDKGIDGFTLNQKPVIKGYKPSALEGLLSSAKVKNTINNAKNRNPFRDIVENSGILDR